MLEPVLAPAVRRAGRAWMMAGWLITWLKYLRVSGLTRLEEGVVHLGAGRMQRAETELPPGATEYELVLCVLRLEAPLDQVLLDRVRPPDPPVMLPGLQWLDEVNGDRATALEQFVTGWYTATARVREGPPSA